MANYVINIINKEKNIATSKAKDDVTRFLNEEGYLTIELKTFKNRLDKLIYSNSVIRKKFCLMKANDLLILQYPTYLGYRFEKKLISYLKSKKVKIIILIHDIDSLRFRNSRQPSLSDEIKELNRADCVIASNDVMGELLKKNGLNSPMISLGIFDYYHNDKISTELSYSKELNFAGNLDKSKFIYSYPEQSQIKLNLFGYSSDSSKIPEYLNYEGVFPADTLTKEFTGGFGLVWDGTNSSKIEGLYGEYLRYNNPHKLSLFVSAGMPVVIWEGAALAEFVKANKLGILVESLSNLDEEIGNVTQHEYKSMCLNAEAMADKLIHGFFVKKAVKIAKKLI
ncbi:hypothetical protein SIN07_06625 [Pediococcus inopinatus]|uniref:hypothetical protein n=1 Tax=Pediococcus inopinatus TaxID=114090 RepID=UPI002A6ADBA1|nr:hypothetical protein [Pediococcus inopinatus]WPP08687.1 hypothetical protein SIN07_06625 [Pediococcus inopinatus]